MSIELKVAEVIQKPVGRDISGVDYSFPTNGLADMLLFTDGTGISRICEKRGRYW